MARFPVISYDAKSILKISPEDTEAVDVGVGWATMTRETGGPDGTRIEKSGEVYWVHDGLFGAI